MGSMGPRCTWSYGRVGFHQIRERLNKGLTNRDWLTLFPRAIIRVLPRFSSNNAPIFLQTSGAMGAGPKPFPFETCWVRDEDSKVVVQRSWNRPILGSASFRLAMHIKLTKTALGEWNKDVFGVVQVQIKSLQECLNFVQHLSPSDQSWEAEKRI